MLYLLLLGQGTGQGRALCRLELRPQGRAWTQVGVGARQPTEGGGGCGWRRHPSLRSGCRLHGATGPGDGDSRLRELSAWRQGHCRGTTVSSPYGGAQVTSTPPRPPSPQLGLFMPLLPVWGSRKSSARPAAEEGPWEKGHPQPWALLRGRVPRALSPALGHGPLDGIVPSPVLLTHPGGLGASELGLTWDSWEAGWRAGSAPVWKLPRPQTGG